MIVPLPTDYKSSDAILHGDGPGSGFTWYSIGVELPLFVSILHWPSICKIR